jgi:hypothetical protein
MPSAFLRVYASPQNWIVSVLGLNAAWTPGMILSDQTSSLDTPGFPVAAGESHKIKKSEVFQNSRNKAVWKVGPWICQADRRPRWELGMDIVQRVERKGI